MTVWFHLRIPFLTGCLCALALTGCVSTGSSSSSGGTSLASGSPAAERPSAAAAQGRRGQLSLTVRPDPSTGPSALRVVLYEEREAVGATAVQVETRFIGRDMSAPVRPQNTELTRVRLNKAFAKHAETLNKQFRASLQKPEIAKHPTCETATAIEQRAGQKIWFTLNKDLPDEERYCYVVPKGKIPPAFGNPLARLMLLGVQIPLLAHAEVGAHLVADPNITATQLEDTKVLRPFYTGDAIKGSGALKEVGSFVNASLPGTSLRRKVTLLADMVQKLETTELRRTSEGRQTPYPSGAAILFDQRGPADAKAVLLASLIQSVAPETRIVLVEIDDRYLLGVDMPSDARDHTMRLNGFGRGPSIFVVTDPATPVPPGGTAEPAFSAALDDGVITNEEADVVYSVSRFGATAGTRRGVRTGAGA